MINPEDVYPRNPVWQTIRYHKFEIQLEYPEVKASLRTHGVLPIHKRRGNKATRIYNGVQVEVLPRSCKSVFAKSEWLGGSYSPIITEVLGG